MFMRNLFFLLFWISTSTVLFAQETTSADESSDDFVELKKKLNKASDRLVLDFSYDMLLNTPSEVQTKGFSRGFNVYFMYDVVLGKSRFSVAPGLGLGMNNYFHQNSIGYDTTGATVFSPLADGVDFKKNKIGLTYFDIPLEFRYRSKPNAKNNSWKLAAGFKAGIILHSKWKYNGDEIRAGFDETRQVKFKEFNIDNLNRFRYGLTLRGGYGIWNAFVYYSLSDVFSEGNGPRMTPLSFGISINGL
jgi:hypothetical protein